MAECSVEGCIRDSVAKEFCNLHYRRWRKYGEHGPPLPIPVKRTSLVCSIEGCERKRSRRDLCDTHYSRWKRNGQVGPADLIRPWRHEGPCSVDGCAEKARCKTFCNMHYKRWLRDGEPGELESRRSPAPSDYLGIRLPSGKTTKQHRVVMEQVLGRPLLPHENVHHKNGIRRDNRPENLEVWVTWQPSGQRPEDLVAFVCEHYAEEVKARLGVNS